MINQIQVCSDWEKVSSNLYRTISALGHYRNRAQLQHMVANIGYQVTQLSIEEIECRRLKRQTLRHKELLTKVNTSINEIEQLITFATLLDGTPDD